MPGSGNPKADSVFLGHATSRVDRIEFVPAALPLDRQADLVLIAHQTTDEGVRRAALRVLEQAANPLMIAVSDAS
jgi:hypothetical protein